MNCIALAGVLCSLMVLSSVEKVQSQSCDPCEAYDADNGECVHCEEWCNRIGCGGYACMSTLDSCKCEMCPLEDCRETCKRRDCKSGIQTGDHCGCRKCPWT